MTKHSFGQQLILTGSIVLLTACAGDGNDNSDTAGTTVTMGNFSITEDSSLSENLTGVWLANSDVETTSTYAAGAPTIGTLFDGVIPANDVTVLEKSQTIRTIFIIESENGELHIRGCDHEATQIEAGTSALSFALDDQSYTLSRLSNTHMTGDIGIEYQDDFFQISGAGKTTLTKVRSAPDSIDDLLTSFRLGVFRYTIGNIEGTIAAHCFNAWQGTSSSTDEEAYPSGELNAIQLSAFSDLGPTATRRVAGPVAVATHSDGSSFMQLMAPTFMYLSQDATFSVSGTNRISIEINASNVLGNFEDASSDAFTGTATLNF